MLFLGTTTPLGSAGTWDSSVNSYPGYVAQTNYQMTLQGTLFSDHDGTLYIDQGGQVITQTQYALTVDWDYTITIAYTGGTGITINEPVNSPYIRLRYLNGSSAQTAFRLLCSLND